jgi:hypothetical protein
VCSCRRVSAWQCSRLLEQCDSTAGSRLLSLVCIIETKTSYRRGSIPCQPLTVHRHGNLLSPCSPGVHIGSNEAGRDARHLPRSSLYDSHSYCSKGDASRSRHRLMTFPNKYVILLARSSSPLTAGGRCSWESSIIRLRFSMSATVISSRR